ncbi:glycoside hydrolase family 66 protein [Fictibacillus enclensis]|uniref:glycoside hydrolase family 66 protein n=1 Tax=Fictibacillus enclensis TaxID=1017270 RepID=UPI0025A0574F|nr:glycoside hydrolase family 66 protein [Fictibacillus enclensis]MDM5196543.1 glycoside hydrolase family 66 protein [Fictibacillus enclensis]
MKINKSKRKLSLVCLVALNLTLITQTPVTKAQTTGQQISSKQIQPIKKQLPVEPIQAFLVDKSRYNLGEKVKMSILFDSSNDWKGKLNLEVFHLNEKVAEGKKNIQVRKNVKGLEIEWTPPKQDFRGYLVKASISGSDQIVTAAIDVSSDWTRFPRYGYTTEFPQESVRESEKKMKQLTQEYYLNGFQFYDWMWRHDVSVYSKTDQNGNPILHENGNFITEEINKDTSYKDLLGRDLFPLTVKQQIDAAKKYNAASMAYQMNYAARENYEAFGIKREWGLYKKNAQFPNPSLANQEGFYFDWVNPPTGLFLQDPGNKQWQKYINREFVRSVNEFGFDGMHLDQWGFHDNDYLYDYNGNKRHFSKDYDSLINSVKDSLVENNEKKNFVTFNMVGGNEGYQDVPVSSTKTDFDYSEIWQDKDNYRDLLNVVEETRKTNGGKAVVIAGYMNYKQATGKHYEVADVKGVPKSEQFFSRVQKLPGWVGDFGKQDEDMIIWTVDVPESGTYDVALKNGHDNGSSPEGKISVNNQLVESTISFNEKTGWGNPVAVKNLSLHLEKGTNEIKLQLNTNNLWLNVDSIVVKRDSFEKEYEAEDAELISCKVDKYGHVYNFETDGDFIEFTVNAAQAGTYPISFNYGVERTAVNRHLYVNNELVSDSIKFKPTGGWESLEKSEIVQTPLKAGENKVVLKVENVNDTGAKIDYMTVGDTRYQAEKGRIGWEPSQQPVLEKSTKQINNFKQQGDFISFKMDSDTAKEVPISIFYMNSGQETKRSLLVNGKKAGVVTLRQTEGENWSKVETKIYLYKGLNEVQMKMEDQTSETGIEVDKFEINNTVIEGEQAEIGWSPVIAKTSEVSVSPGFTNNLGKAGQRVIFNVNNEKETNTLRFKYRTANNPKVNIYVDGELIPSNNTYVDGKTISENIFGSTPGGWDGAMVEKSIKATVPVGEHEVVFELASNGEYINLDSVLVGEQEYQVEEAAFAPEGHGISTTIGHIYDFQDEGDFLTFDVNAQKAGKYDLTWRYNNDASSKRDAKRSVYVNDEKIETIIFPSSDGWKDLTTGGISLKEGKNTITIKVENLDDDGVKLDYLKIEDKKYHSESASMIPPMHIYKDTLLHFGHVGDEVTFDVDIEDEGETSFIFTYANAGADTERTIYVDGKPLLDEKGNPYTVTFKSTGNIDSYSEDGYVVLPHLKPGKHKFTLKQEEGQKGSIHLRRMTIGLFDEPSVRLMDAGLAAMGATHIEIGTAEKYEQGPNMLAHEYYPNRSKKMTGSLKESMKDYYKFFAAYENLLFDSKETDTVIKVEDKGQPLVISRDGEKNTIWSIVRDNKNNKGFEEYDIVHLVNLLNNDSNWRNAAAQPKKYNDLKIKYPIGKNEKELPNLKVYSASPDRHTGQLKEIQYQWEDKELVINLPSLEYWEMIVIDRDGVGDIKPSKIKY